MQPLQIDDMFRTRTSLLRAWTSLANWSGIDELTRKEDCANCEEGRPPIVVLAWGVFSERILVLRSVFFWLRPLHFGSCILGPQPRSKAVDVLC